MLTLAMPMAVGRIRRADTPPAKPLNVTLRQLRVFIAVAEAQHLTRASNALDVSQSTVSALVRDLEGNLGLRLFDRQPRMLCLTEAGARILPLARKAVADLDRVIGSSSRLKMLERGQVCVAVACVQGALVLPKVMREFKDANPGVHVLLRDVSQDRVLDLVRTGEADLGVGGDAGVGKDLRSRVLWEEAFVAVLPPKHPLLLKHEVTWKDVQREPVIGLQASSPLRKQLDAVLASAGISVTPCHEVALPLTMIGMIESGLGIGVTTTAIARVACALGLASREISCPVVKRNVALIDHPDRSLSPAAQSFRNLLVDGGGQLGGR